MRLACACAVAAAALGGTASATMCSPHDIGSFAQRAKWPFNRVLIVKVLAHRVVPLGEHRVSYRMDVEVLEDVNGVELRPRVRIVASDPLLFDGDEGFAQGSVWAFALGRPIAFWFKEYGDVWGPDVSPIDYYFGCGSAAEPLRSLDDARRGPVGEVKAFWLKRLGQR
jgi:hypothetical protein